MGDSNWAKNYAGPPRPDTVKIPIECVDGLRPQQQQEPDAEKSPSSRLSETPRSTGNDLVWSSSVNLTQTIIGAGLLALPHSLHEGGAGLGILNILIVGVLSCAGFLAIGYVCCATGAQSYREAWRRSVGAYEVVVDVVVFLECAITMVGFVILILDYLVVGLSMAMGPLGDHRGRLALLLAAGLLLPLSLKSQLHGMRFWSLVGNFAILYMLLFVLLDWAAWDGRWSLLDEVRFLGPRRDGVFRATSVMAAAYMAHQNAPDLFDELAEHPHPWRGFVIAASASFAIAALAYATFAAAGFLRFGSDVRGNVLLNYENDPFALLAWVTMAFALMVSFPLQCKPARDTVAKSLGLSLRIGEAGVPREWVSVPVAIVTVALVALVTVLGVTFEDISFVLGFRGALLGLPLSFVMPGLMLLRCPASQGRGEAVRQTVCGWVLVVFGAAASGLGLFCALR